MPAQATILKNILSFTGLVVGVPASLPHLLNVNGTGVYPDIVLPDIVGGFTITADATNVTVTRLVGSSASVDVYVERWHTIEYVTPPGELATKIPFVVTGGVGGAPTGPPGAVAFFDAGGNLAGDQPEFGWDDTLHALAIGPGSIATGAASFSQGIATTANGDGSHAEGASTIAGGAQAHAEGDGCQASGDFSHAEGESTLASGVASHATGLGTTASGLASAAFGNGSTASGDEAFATGILCTASALAAVALGKSNQATAEAACAIGEGTTASGAQSLASGNGTVASGDLSAAFNQGVTASGAASVAFGAQGTAQGYGSFGRGVGYLALRDTQESFASGIWVGQGSAQTSLLVLAGEVPGLATGESCDLVIPVTGVPFELEDGKGYTVEVSVVARATSLVQTFKQSFSARRDAGTSVIAGSSAQEQFGDAAAVSWTFAASIGAGPDRLRFTFTTGSTKHAVNVVARVQFTEAQTA